MIQSFWFWISISKSWNEPVLWYLMPILFSSWGCQNWIFLKIKISNSSIFQQVVFFLFKCDNCINSLRISCMHTMYFHRSQLASLPVTSPRSTTYILTPSQLPVHVFYNSLSPVCATPVLTSVRAPTGTWLICQKPHPWGKWTLSPQKP